MKNALDCPGPRRTTAWALLLDGAPAGRLISDYSDAGVCYATLQIWAGPLHLTDAEGVTLGRTGRAAGYGYDKLSGAVYDAFRRTGDTFPTLDHGTGASSIRVTLEAQGYQVVEVL